MLRLAGPNTRTDSQPPSNDSFPDLEQLDRPELDEDEDDWLDETAVRKTKVETQAAGATREITRTA